ncbi:hypothetical protein H6F32_08210 [Anabaena sp. FACHB-1237]|uniref:hypothetical protein n=1 Tax=Anabaena sp. FACHB-1237 TaxID=2692769 RepID=UPI001681A812|nr:hypothetical protein [Anabaena sp. FACHB-1237]MBD2137568.1 hypothetical protein [Anabaena sp. FACHB-1237]
MSEKPIESYGKSFLVLILPISFVIVFVVNTWKVLLVILGLLIAVNLWQNHRWEKWCQQVNPLFYEMIRENQGKITPIDLALRGNFSGKVATRYLETKAVEFGANVQKSQGDDHAYYFITASILGDIFDSSEPIKQLPDQAVNKAARSFLVPPPPLPIVEEIQPEELAETEIEPSQQIPEQQNNIEEVKKPLEEQLVFGSLIQSELAKRLNVYSSTVYKRRNDPDFAQWSRSRDPDGIAWSYSRKTREFFPLEE